jgi:hypothetical protein
MDKCPQCKNDAIDFITMCVNCEIEIELEKADLDLKIKAQGERIKALRAALKFIDILWPPPPGANSIPNLDTLKLIKKRVKEALEDTNE